jgi:hypothetical protein
MARHVAISIQNYAHIPLEQNQSTLNQDAAVFNLICRSHMPYVYGEHPSYSDSCSSTSQSVTRSCAEAGAPRLPDPANQRSRVSPQPIRLERVLAATNQLQAVFCSHGCLSGMILQPFVSPGSWRRWHAVWVCRGQCASREVVDLVVFVRRSGIANLLTTDLQRHRAAAVSFNDLIDRELFAPTSNIGGSGPKDERATYICR